MIIAIIRSFLRHGCFDLAAKIAFYTLLAIIPLTMIMVSIAGFFLGESTELTSEIAKSMMGLFPVLRDEIVANIQSLMEQRQSLGLAGGGLLLFSATFLMSAVERSLDTVLQSERKRHFLLSHLLGIVVIVLMSLLFFVPPALQLVEGMLARFSVAIPFAGVLNTTLFFLVTAFSSYVIVIVVIPNRRLSFRSAAIGGLVFAGGLSIAKNLFRWYMAASLSRYNLIYGSFTAIIIFILWIYYVAVVMLLAAETAARVHTARAGRQKGV